MVKKILIALLIIAIIIGGFFFFKHMNDDESSNMPNDAQNNTNVPDNWLTFTDTQNGITFKYPADLGTTYIHTVDWPPVARVVPETFACVEAGSETSRAGETERVTIGGNDYCVTKVTEGAAGSIYTMYAYATQKEGKTVILTFSLRSVQCANYADTQRAACEQERAQFSVDQVVDQIFGTMTL